MKKMIYGLKLCSVVMVSAGMIFSTGTVFAEKGEHKPVTLSLIKLVEKNPEIGAMLEASLVKAKKINPDKLTNPAQSLSEYYDNVDVSVELIPKQVLKNPANLIREQIMQMICYFYFLVDQPLKELEGKGLYKNSLQYYGPFSAWLREYVKAWGVFLDTEASWNEETYKGFYNDPRFGLQEDWYEPKSNWHTWNRFFSKYLKSKDRRPIASPDDTSVVAFPADSVPQGVWAIDKYSKIKVEDGLKIKLARYYSIEELLGKNSPYKDAFANGVLTHTFLDVNDYHRYHFAVGGEIKEKKIISNNVALEVVWSPKEGKYAPIDSTGWQFTQTRGLVVVDTGKYGLVALLPMGMAQVSSVNFEDIVQVGITYEKGDMLGTFLFGGSDFVMVFQKKAGFEITAEVNKHHLMGEKYGVMKGKKSKKK